MQCVAENTAAVTSQLYAVIDLPSSLSWFFCVVLDFGAASGTASGFPRFQPSQTGPCYSKQIALQCGLPATALAVTSCMLLVIVSYFVLYCVFLLQAMRQLRANPNVEFKLANTIVRIQVSKNALYLRALPWIFQFEPRLLSALHILLHNQLVGADRKIDPCWINLGASSVEAHSFECS